jgi:hypothetical protein
VRRDGVQWTEGFWTHLDPHNPGDVGGPFVELHPVPRVDAATVDTWIDRTPTAAYHRGTGMPLQRRDLGSWFEYRLDRGPNPIQRLPQFVRPQEPADLCSGEAADEYHLVRAFMRALGRWRQQRCPLARWAIIGLAEDARLAYTMQGKPQDAGSSWVPFSVTSMLAGANANPEHGGRIVRGIAWVLRLLDAALEVGTPYAAETQATIAALLTYWETVVTPGGALYNAPRFNANGDETWADNGEAWHLYDMASNKSECPSWQVPFGVRALWEAQHQMPRLRPRVVALLARIKRLWDTCAKVPDMYGGAPGLPLYLVTAVDGVPVRRITEGVGQARSMYDADAFACFREAGLGGVPA